MSLPEQTPEKPQKNAQPDYIPMERLLSVTFTNAVTFANAQITSARVTVGTPVGQLQGTVDGLYAARLEPDGRATIIASGQNATGLLLRRKSLNRAANRLMMEQTFVPFTNVQSLIYGE